ncbi:nucleotide-binding alpha-beta plait domain-containing protein [Tanacetum coccineum]
MGIKIRFVRFFNVFNLERLVVIFARFWVGRSKLHANVARFHRTPLKINKASKDNVYEPKRKSNVNENGSSKAGKSYTHVLKTHNSFEALDCESAPSIVLDDDCLNSRDLSKTLLGRVNAVCIFVDLKVVLKENRGVGSWFSVLKQTSTEFVPEGRILWVEIEGVPFKLWSKNTFKKIASKWGEILDTEDQEEDGFYTKRLCIYSKLGNNIYENFKIIFHAWCVLYDDVDDVDKVPETELDDPLEQKQDLPSDDPFDIYSILNK